MIKGFISILAVVLSFGYLHDFHVSISQIEHNTEAQTLEVAMRIFIDDLEKALTKDENDKVVLDKAADKKKNDSLLQAYLKENFAVKVNETAKSFEYIGSEIEQDVVWCYLEVKEVKSIQKLWLKNTVLMRLFENQSNIMQVEVGDKKESLLLSRSSYDGTIDF